MQPAPAAAARPGLAWRAWLQPAARATMQLCTPKKNKGNGHFGANPIKNLPGKKAFLQYTSVKEHPRGDESWKSARSREFQDGNASANSARAARRSGQSKRRSRSQRKGAAGRQEGRRAGGRAGRQQAAAAGNCSSHLPGPSGRCRRRAFCRASEPQANERTSQRTNERASERASARRLNLEACQQLASALWVASRARACALLQAKPVSFRLDFGRKRRWWRKGKKKRSFVDGVRWLSSSSSSL